jgi:GNAT superfamily N-acetyltransferase
MDFQIELRELAPGSRELVANIVASGMAISPLHRVIHGRQQPMLQSSLARGFGVALEISQRPGLVAWHGDVPVGVLVFGRPGACPATAAQRIRLRQQLTEVLRPEIAERFLAWRTEWISHEPAQPHWHLGPLAAVQEYLGFGIGSALVTRFLAEVDAQNGVAYVETDTPRNAAFYRRFGFETQGESDVLGVRCFYMLRPAQPHTVVGES